MIGGKPTISILKFKTCK